MSLRRLNASVLSPLLAFPVAWALTALLAQIHLLHIQGPWSTVMVAVVIAVPFAFVAGGLIGEGVAIATTALGRARVPTRIPERTFRVILVAIVAIGLLEVAHQIARAGTIPLLSGSIDAARFSQGGPTILLVNLLTVAAIVSLVKPRDLLAREARFELATAAVALGAFGLQGGRGSVVLPVVVAIIARWLYWGRPSPYLLTAGGLLAFLAICFGFYLRTYQHPTTPFEAELFSEVLPTLPFFVKPLVPVYLALTTNFVALHGIVDYFPTVGPFGDGAYNSVALDSFISVTRNVSEVSGALTPPWVTSTVAGSFWADGGFAVLVPGIALTGGLAAGAYVAATRTLSFRWALVAAYLFYVALFGLYTNLWTQHLDWLIVAPLLLVFGAFAEDPAAPPGIVGRAWGKIRRMRASGPTPAPVAPAQAEERALPAEDRRRWRAPVACGAIVIAVVLIAGLIVQRTLPEPFPLVRTMALPGSVERAEAVFTDSQRSYDNTQVYWVNRAGATTALSRFDPITQETEVTRFRVPPAPGATQYDVGFWAPLRVPVLFEIRQAPKRVFVTLRRSDNGAPVGRFSRALDAPAPDVVRDAAIALYDAPRPDLFLIDRGPATARVRLSILSGESGFRHQVYGTPLPFRGLRPRLWSVEIGELAGKTDEQGQQVTPVPDLVLLERDPDRKRTGLKVLGGEDGYEGFAYQRDIAEPGDLPQSRIFLQGSLRGAPSLFEVVPDAPDGPQLRVFEIQPPAGFL